MNTSSNKRSFVLIDFRTDKQIVNNLENLGYTVLFTKSIDVLYDGLRGHADMQICKVGNKYICEPRVYEYYKQYINKENLICGSKKLSLEYPDDIYYNICVVGKNVICNTKYTTVELNRIFENDAELNLIHVKQGYSKCNTCVVAENAIITSDDSIYKAAKENKIDVLKISSGCIKLKGFNYGFIGGATGLIEKNKLAVAGSLKHHPDYNNIKAYCNDFGVNLIELSQNTAEDIGSIIKITV